MESTEPSPSRYRSRVVSSSRSLSGNLKTEPFQSKHEDDHPNSVSPTRNRIKNRLVSKSGTKQTSSARMISIPVWIPSHLIKDNMFNRDITDLGSKYKVSLVELPDDITAGQVLANYISHLLKVKISPRFQLWELCDTHEDKENKLPMSITRPVGYEEVVCDIVSSWSTNYSRNCLKLKVKSDLNEDNKESVLTFLSDLRNHKNFFLEQQKVTDMTLGFQKIYYWKDCLKWKQTYISINQSGLLTIWKKQHRDIIRNIKSIHEFELYDITSPSDLAQSSSFPSFSLSPSSIGKYQFALKSHRNPDLFEDRQDLIHVFSLDNYNEYVNLAKIFSLLRCIYLYETSEKRNKPELTTISENNPFINRKTLDNNGKFINRTFESGDEDNSSDEDLPISLLEMKLTEKAKNESFFNSMPPNSNNIKPETLLSKLDSKLIEKKNEAEVKVNSGLANDASNSPFSYSSSANSFRSNGLIGKTYGSLSASSSGNEPSNHNIVDKRIRPDGLIGRRLQSQNNTKNN